MSEVLPRHYIIGIIIFTFFIIGGVSIMGMLAGEEDSAFAGDQQLRQFNETFNIQEDITREVGDLEASVSDPDLDPGPFGMLNALISSAWTSLSLMFDSFSFMTSVFGGLSTMFGVPVWIPALIGLIIVVLLVFAIFGAIFQSKI